MITSNGCYNKPTYSLNSFYFRYAKIFCSSCTSLSLISFLRWIYSSFDIATCCTSSRACCYFSCSTSAWNVLHSINIFQHAIEIKQCSSRAQCKGYSAVLVIKKYQTAYKYMYILNMYKANFCSIQTWISPKPFFNISHNI